MTSNIQSTNTYGGPDGEIAKQIRFVNKNLLPGEKSICIQWSRRGNPISYGKFLAKLDVSAIQKAYDATFKRVYGDTDFQTCVYKDNEKAKTRSIKTTITSMLLGATIALTCVIALQLSNNYSK
jgi:hypothetical protein